MELPPADLLRHRVVYISPTNWLIIPEGSSWSGWSRHAYEDDKQRHSNPTHQLVLPQRASTLEHLFTKSLWAHPIFRNLPMERWWINVESECTRRRARSASILDSNRIWLTCGSSCPTYLHLNGAHKVPPPFMEHSILFTAKFYIIRVHVITSLWELGVLAGKWNRTDKSLSHPHHQDASSSFQLEPYTAWWPRYTYKALVRLCTDSSVSGRNSW